MATSVPEGNVPAVAASQTLIVTGHQAIVFHPGIEWKYFVTGQFAREQRGASLAIIMDLDPGDAGGFLVPCNASEGVDTPGHGIEQCEAPPCLVTEVRSLACAETGLFATARVGSRTQLLAIAEEVEQRLDALQRHEAAREAAQTLELYGQLEGLPLVDAHPIVQAARGRLHVDLLLPFSTLMRLDPYQSAIEWLLDDAANLFASYNRLLEAYREEHGVRNHANPFPNLGQDGDLRELPFWLVDHSKSERETLWYRDTQSGPKFMTRSGALVSGKSDATARDLLALLPTHLQVVPRGALISLLFRTIACDLFVHGTGGGTYDPFTDRLMRDYLGVQSPVFAVASGTRYLFETWPERITSWDELAAQSRDVRHHPENYFGRGWFEESAEQSLRGLVASKQETVERLLAARQTGQSGAAMGQRLEELATAIRVLVDAQLAPKLAMRDRMTESTREALLERRWPWFYFEGPRESWRIQSIP